MSSGVYTLLGNVSATGPGTPAPIGFAGRYLFEVSGTFAAAAVTLEILMPDNTTWFTLRDFLGAAVSFTANGVTYVELPAGASVRANITGGAPVGISARLRFAGR